MNRQAFTVIEIMLGIVIIAILATIVIPKFIDIRNDAIERSEAYTIGAVREAIQQSYARSLIRDAVPVYPPYLDDELVAQIAPASNENPLFNEVLTGITSQWELLSMAPEESWYRGPTDTEYQYDPLTGTITAGAFAGGDGGDGGEPGGNAVTWGYPGAQVGDLNITVSDVDMGGANQAIDIGLADFPMMFDGNVFTEFNPDTTGSDGVYGVLLDDGAKCMDLTYDDNGVHDGYIMAGSMTVSGDSGVYSNMYLVKVNLDGTLAWSKSFDRMGETDYVSSIKQTPDRGYIVVGSSSGSTPLGSSQDAFIMKLDSDGNLYPNAGTGAPGGWSLVYGAPGASDSIKSVALSTDVSGDPDGYIVTGWSESNDDYVAKIDLNGNMEWSNTYLPTGFDSSFDSVIQASDGSYMVTGSSIDSSRSWISDALLVNIDRNGGVNWGTTYGASSSQTNGGSGLRETFDTEGNPDGFVMTGRIGQSGFVTKVDTSGNRLWSKAVDGDGWERYYDIEVTSDGGFLISGDSIDTYAGGVKGAFAVKMDSNADLEWSKSYGIESSNNGVGAMETADGGYAILLSNDIRGGNYQDDFVLLKADSQGNIN